MAGACRRRRGGILSLLDVLSENGYAVEADLRRYYGVDIADFWRGDITYRQLLVYLSHLPPESKTASLMNSKPELEGWGLSEYLMGMLVDRLGEMNYMYASTHVDEKHKNTVQAPESVFPDSAIEKTVREEVDQMSVSDFFSPADIFAEIAQHKKK